MATLIIHSSILSLIYWLATGAVVSSKVEELAALEEYQLFNHLASSYSSIQNIIDIISLKRSTQNSTNDKIIISQNLRQLSIDLKLYLEIFQINMIQQSYFSELVDKLTTMMGDINGILEECFSIIERPREINTTGITDLLTSLEFINLKMTLWQPCCWFDFMKWITSALNLDNKYAYCKENTSSHQTLFHITKDLITLDLTTFAVLKLFHPQNNNSSERGIIFHVSNYVSMTRRIRTYITTASKLLAERPNIIYSCDIVEYIRDTNYIELKGLLEPIFISTYGLKSCEEANRHSDIHGCKTYDEAFGVTVMEKELLIPAECDGVKQHVFLPLPFDRPCYGHLSNCTEYKTKEVCRGISPSGFPRYSWYKINGHVFGQENSCPHGRFEDYENMGIRKNTPLLRPCHCTCTNNGRRSSATHLLNLAWSFSDVEDNKIIIGVKFIKIDTMISLQIKQGILGEEGRIVPTSENWMSQFYGRDDNSAELKSIALDENTAFDLDDVMADPGSLITGVRFYLLGQRIKLMVQQTKFKWQTGKLNNDISKEIFHPISNKRQLHFPLRNPALPLFNYENVDISEPNKYHIKLAESERRDSGGGVTLPFFDAQNVEVEPGSPLSGIGLYYRGSKESAGLISLRLFGLNYTDMLVDYELKYLHIYGINNLVNV